MKVLLLNGSARKNGGTATMSEAFARGARESGHEVNVLDIAQMNIHGCLGCEGCHASGSGKCVQRDDMDLVYPLWDSADVIIVASPVYYGSFSGQMHCLIHRTYAGDKPKKCKAMALFLCSGSRGVYEASERIYHGFMQGYYGVQDLGVFEATTAVAKSEDMTARLTELGQTLSQRVGM